MTFHKNNVLYIIQKTKITTWKRSLSSSQSLRWLLRAQSRRRPQGRNWETSPPSLKPLPWASRTASRLQMKILCGKSISKSLPPHGDPKNLRLGMPYTTSMGMDGTSTCSTNSRKSMASSNSPHWSSKPVTEYGWRVTQTFWSLYNATFKPLSILRNPPQCHI